jgi:hypothetical protein
MKLAYTPGSELLVLQRVDVAQLGKALVLSGCSSPWKKASMETIAEL